VIFAKLNEQETEQDFVNRLMADPEVRNSMGGEKWPKLYRCRFIEPGLVHYNEFGTVLVQKPALDKMAKSFVGKPVVNVVHKDVSPSDFSMGNADGIVTDVWYDPDGWFWAKFLVWDPATQRNCESAAYSVSCAYDLLESKDEGGMHNNITYSQEVVDGEYTHLAIVANPRYEGARILYNSKGGTDMKWKFWQGGKEKVELKNISEESTVDIDGKEVSIKQLVELHNSAAKPAKTKISIDSIVEADGKEISVKDLVEGYKNSIKNADDDKDDEKKKKENAEDEEKEKKEKEAKNAEDEKKKKDDEERKNAEEKDKKDKEDKEKRENEGEKHFVDVRNAAQIRGAASMPTLITRNQRMQEGAKRYGSAKVETK
jgi:hypothetical protein